jgi:2-polyprenyl-3-methyl-5-hydroxy-6-metoxy-1,4-benzoquinol methylase
MSAIEKDFDRLALLDDGGWTHNNHYHHFLLQHVPEPCLNALEVGCGTGAFSRQLGTRSQHVLAIDLSSEMVRVARDRSPQSANIEFRIADVMATELPQSHFDCIATIATLHHMPLHEIILKLKQALKPGGVLLVLDLFEPERNLLTPNGLADASLNFVAMGASVMFGFINNGRLKPPREAQAAWEAHGHTDSYPSMDQLRKLAAEILPGAMVRKHLLWRYSLIWRRS